jgi:hypothetical protein
MLPAAAPDLALQALQAQFIVSFQPLTSPNAIIPSTVSLENASALALTLTAKLN